MVERRSRSFVCSPSLGTRSAGTDPTSETGHPHTLDVARIVALRARRGLVSFRCGQIVARFVWFRFDSLRLAAKRGPLRLASWPYVAVSIRSRHAALPNVAVSFANAPVRPVRYQRRTHTLCRTATSRTSPTCWGDHVKLPGGTSPSCRGGITDLPGQLCQASWNRELSAPRQSPPSIAGIAARPPRRRSWPPRASPGPRPARTRVPNAPR